MTASNSPPFILLRDVEEDRPFRRFNLAWKMCSYACARRITRSPRGIYTSSIGCTARGTLRAVAPIYPTFLCRELFSFFLFLLSPFLRVPLPAMVPWPLAFYSISAGTFKCTYSLVHSDRAPSNTDAGDIFIAAA